MGAGSEKVAEFYSVENEVQSSSLDIAYKQLVLPNLSICYNSKNLLFLVNFVASCLVGYEQLAMFRI